MKHPSIFQPQSALVKAALVTLTASYLLARASLSAADSETPRIDSIRSAMETAIGEGQISGAVTLVGHDGHIAHLDAAGLANIAKHQPMRADTLFSIASMTKPIVATALLLLQEEGKLSVDDPIAKYIPEFESLKLENGDAPTRPLTLKDAITHTSGLSGSQRFSGTLAEAVKELAQGPLAFQPGTEWRYSPGLNVAGRVIEIVSERPLAAFLDAQIFQPLGMRDTTFSPNAEQRTRLATLYKPGEKDGDLKAAENSITQGAAPDAANPSGGLFSTANDLFKFYQMILNGGAFEDKRIVSKKTVRLMTSNHTDDLETGFTPGNCWGLGWCVVREPQGVTAMLNPGTIGHGGAFGTQGWVDPQTKTIYVLLIQRTEFGNSDGSELRGDFQQLASDNLNL